jgi:ABC-2 type transport system permease protein
MEAKVYFKLLRLHLLSGMEYKGWWMMLIQVGFVVVTDPLSTVLLFSRFGSIGEWSVERIILIYALAVASFGLAESLCRGFDYFPWQMLRSGELTGCCSGHVRCSCRWRPPGSTCTV